MQIYQRVFTRGRTPSHEVASPYTTSQLTVNGVTVPAMDDDSAGPRKIRITGGDGDRAASGLVEPVLGSTQRPCVMCRSFERDVKRLTEHLLAHGLKPEPDGSFVSPIAKDFKDPRANLRMHPREFGYCRLTTMPVQDVATCPSWVARTVLKGA